MLHNTIQIALGVCYGIYLAFLAPASQRQKAYNWAKQQDTAANLDKQPVFFQVETKVVASKPELLVDTELLENPWLAEPSFTTTQSQESSVAIAAVSSPEVPLLPPVTTATLDWLVARVQPVTEEFSEVDILALARERVKSVIDLTTLKIYKLRGESVVCLSDLAINIPTTLKRYKLRGKDVVKLSALEAAIA